jgi:hypothetical protein
MHECRRSLPDQPQNRRHRRKTVSADDVLANRGRAAPERMVRGWRPHPPKHPRVRYAASLSSPMTGAGAPRR